MQEKGARIMPKTVDPITGEIKHFDYSAKGKQEAEQHASETGAEVIPTYDAGGRVQNIKGYGESMLPEPNGAMSDEEAVKYLNPLATAEEGGKIYKKGGKTYEEKGKTLYTPIKVEGQKGKVTSRRGLKEAVAEKEVKESQGTFDQAFARARKDKKDTFIWKGKKYNTRTKE